MDPLSFTASLISVVTLAAEVVKTCKSYIDGIANYPRELRLIYIEVNSVKSILGGLTLLREADFEDAKIIEQLKGNNGPIKGCEETMLELDAFFKEIPTSGTAETKRSRIREKLWKLRLPTLDELAWPSRRDKAVTLLNAIATHKQTINTALAASLLSEVQSIKTKLDQAEQDRLHAWLVEVNPSSNHNAAKSLYETGTGDWIFHSQEWNIWVSKGSKERSLWIHGIPGAGKTILASHIIEQLSETKRSENAMLVYYYCYHSHNRDETSSFLRWLVSQICRNTDTVSTLTYDIYRSGQDPDATKLLSALHSQLIGLDTVYVVVDALDESQQPRDTFLGVLRTLATDPQFQKIRLLTTSREYADIERVMDPISLSVSTSLEEVEKDIRIFVEKKISKDDNFKRWPHDLKFEVVDALAKGAQGMFRWAVCQLDILRRINCATDGEVRQTIKTLPKDLEETYIRILNLIHPDDLQLVRFTISWIIYMEDLVENLTWLVDVSNVLRHYMLHRYGSSDRANQISISCNLDTLKECCGCLVSFSTGIHDERRQEITVCKLSHYTVKEFLQSPRFEKTDQFVGLDLAGMKNHLPNLTLQLVIDHNRRYPEARLNAANAHRIASKLLKEEELLHPKLAFSFFLMEVKMSPLRQKRQEGHVRTQYALSFFLELNRVGKKPSDEIIVLLCLLALDALHLAQKLLETAGSHLLCSYLGLKLDRSKIFEGNVIQFIAAVDFNSRRALLFLLEHYYHDFADSVDLNHMLRWCQRRRDKELTGNHEYNDPKDSEEIFAKVVQKLHDLGAVSVDENICSDCESDGHLIVGGRRLKAMAEQLQSSKQTLPSHDRPEGRLDFVLPDIVREYLDHRLEQAQH